MIDQRLKWMLIEAIDNFVKECGRIADEHDFFKTKEEEDLLHHIALIVSELGECVEAYRDDRFEGDDGVFVELADTIIRIFSVMAHQNCKSFGKVLVDKMIFNESRPKSHGRKKN